jgi:hypothetical protein
VAQTDCSSSGSGQIGLGQFDSTRFLGYGFDWVRPSRVSDHLVSGHFEFWV